MNLYKNEDGYTIIEILVALVLVSILLMFTSNVFTLVTSKSLSNSKIQAIEIAKEWMHKTVTFKDFNTIEKEIAKKFVMKRSVTKNSKNLVIKITLIEKGSQRILYELQALRIFGERK